MNTDFLKKAIRLSDDRGFDPVPSDLCPSVLICGFRFFFKD